MEKGEEENLARLDEWEDSGEDFGEEEGNSVRPNEWRDSDEDSEEEQESVY